MQGLLKRMSLLPLLVESVEDSTRQVFLGLPQTLHESLCFCCPTFACLTRLLQALELCRQVSISFDCLLQGIDRLVSLACPLSMKLSRQLEILGQFFDLSFQALVLLSQLIDDAATLGLMLDELLCCIVSGLNRSCDRLSQILNLNINFNHIQRGRRGVLEE